MKQYQEISAVFSPRRTDDLRDEAKDWIGREMTWSALWVIDYGQYEGEWAMMPKHEVNAPFAWVPSGDLLGLSE